MRLAFERARFDQWMIGHAHGVDDNEAVLDVGVRRYAAEFVGRKNANAPALHLFEVVEASHIAQEEKDLQWADVGPRRDHVYGHDNARIVGRSEERQNALGLVSRLNPFSDRLFRPVVALYLPADSDLSSSVGYLLAEIVAFAELLADDLHNIIGVAVVAGEHKRLRDFGAAGKDVGKELVAKFADDGANLVGGDNVAIEILRRVGKLRIEKLSAAGASKAIALVNPVAGFDARTCRGDPRVDAVEVETDIHSISDGILVRVGRHHVLVEEAEGVLGWCSREADNE